MFRYVPASILKIYKDEEYAIKALDNSMTPKIKYGDIVYCRSTNIIENGNIVHYSFNGKTGIRKYFLDNDIISLTPLNPSFKTITINMDKKHKLFMSKVVGKIDRDF